MGGSGYENDLHGNQLSGAVPEAISKLTELTTLALHDNRLIDLPDLSSLSNLGELHVQHNKLTFEDLEPNVDGGFVFFYSPQDEVGEELEMVRRLGEAATFSVNVGGSANTYQWMWNGAEIDDAREDHYTISDIKEDDAGSYVCRITNSIATELTLLSRPITLRIDGTTDVSDPTEQIPLEFVLKQNYPNPFNPETRIRYELPKATQVRMEVFSLLGQRVRTLTDQQKPAGIHSVIWDGRDDSGVSMPSGVYVYRLVASESTQSRKLLLLR